VEPVVVQWNVGCKERKDACFITEEVNCDLHLPHVSVVTEKSKISAKKKGGIQ
jgi:hypothetical protein